MAAVLTINDCNLHNKEVPGKNEDTFQYYTEKFADIKILRYQVPGFEDLSLRQKKLIYHLSQAALAGRDIVYDQNGRYNLAILRTLENIVLTYTGDRSTEEFEKFMVYTKCFWFSNGIYHHYSSDKFLPNFSKEFFDFLVKQSDPNGFPLEEEKEINDLMQIIVPVMFNPEVMPKKVSQDPSKDMVLNSSGNFYEGVNEKEVEDYYKKLKNPVDKYPVSYGLNSKLVKKDGEIIEKVYKSGGMYGAAIDEIIKHLILAKEFTDNEQQNATILSLISYYKTGNLKKWDEYNMEWVKDTSSHVDFVNGFVEVYDDPLAIKATWESIVNFKDIEATHRTELLSSNAQWFENNAPIDDMFKKSEVKGVSAKVITVAQLGGACHPATPIGINLPNSDWIRKEYGSKSVTIDNITYAYERVSLKSGFLEEFAVDQAEIDIIRKYGYLMSAIHTDLHECLGHGSGQMNYGVTAEMLKSYHSTLEETRADLFALYYIMDKKMVELGLVPTLDAAKAEYIKYIRNGLLTQLVRVEPGKNLEESHMRNRQLISKWCFENGKVDNVIEKFKRDGKTYIRINDYDKLRELIAKLLKEVQRIKSEGDYEAGKALVENYGVAVDQELLLEIRERYYKLNLAPYSGFINPEYEFVTKDGEVIDVIVSYPVDFTRQMLEYGKKYSFLPTYN